MFFSLFLSVAGLFSSKDNNPSIIIEDYPFKLCYVITTRILFFCSSLLGLQDGFGKNINCWDKTGNDQFGNVVNQYCWITGTHRLGDHEWHNISSQNASENEKIVHSYYQWIPYFLILLGLFFYLPKLCWDRLEEGKMKSISEGVVIGSNTLKSEKWLENREKVAKNITNYINSPHAGHKRYGFGYLLAQTLNLTVVVWSFWFTDQFLDQKFNSLGLDWIESFSSEKPGTNLEELFPRRSGCIFKHFGAGGDTLEKKYICVLAPNALSEKIFVFLWFWLMFLMILLSLNLIALFAMLVKSSHIRKIFLTKATKNVKDIHQVFNDNLDFNRALRKMHFGQMLFLYFFGRNVDYIVYEKVLEDLSKSKLVTEKYKKYNRNEKSDVNQFKFYNDMELINRNPKESEDAFYPKAPMFDDSTLPAEYKKKVPDSLKNQ